MEEVRLKNIFIGDPDGLAEARKDKFNEFFYKKNMKNYIIIAISSL